MRLALDIPWYRYALIVALAEKMQGKGYWFGKTALQKLVYLLGAIYKVLAAINIHCISTARFAAN